MEEYTFFDFDSTVHTRIGEHKIAVNHKKITTILHLMYGIQVIYYKVDLKKFGWPKYRDWETKGNADVIKALAINPVNNILRQGTEAVEHEFPIYTTREYDEANVS